MPRTPNGRARRDAKLGRKPKRVRGPRQRNNPPLSNQRVMDELRRRLAKPVIHPVSGARIFPDGRIEYP